MAEASHVHKKVKKKFRPVFLKGTQQKGFHQPPQHSCSFNEGMSRVHGWRMRQECSERAEPRNVWMGWKKPSKKPLNHHKTGFSPDLERLSTWPPDAASIGTGHCIAHSEAQSRPAMVFSNQEQSLPTGEVLSISALCCGTLPDQKQSNVFGAQKPTQKLSITSLHLTLRP